MEWQEEKNPWGGVQRFRMVNGVKEYEPKIMSTYGEVTQSQLEEINRRKGAEPLEAMPPQRYCPIRAGICSGDGCALYSGGCMLSRITTRRQPVKYTKGLICPLTNTACIDNCSLYGGGCILTRFLKGEKNE